MYDQEDFGGGFGGEFTGGFGGGGDGMDGGTGFMAGGNTQGAPDKPKKRDAWRPAMLSQFTDEGQPDGHTPLDGDGGVLVVRVLRKDESPNCTTLLVTDGTSTPVEAKVYPAPSNGDDSNIDLNKACCNAVVPGTYVRLFATASVRTDSDDSGRPIRVLNLLVQRAAVLRDHNEIPFHAMQCMLVEAEMRTGMRLCDVTSTDAATKAQSVAAGGSMKPEQGGGGGDSNPTTAVFEFIRLNSQPTGLHFNEIVKGCSTVGDATGLRGVLDELAVCRGCIVVDVFVCMFVGH